MNLEDLRLKLKFLEDGDRVYKLETKINDFYVIKDNGWYGIGIDINLDKTEYFEKFENVRLITKIKYFSNENHKLLELITDKADLIEEFSLVCFDFINKLTFVDSLDYIVLHSFLIYFSLYNNPIGKELNSNKEINFKI